LCFINLNVQSLTSFSNELHRETANSLLDVVRSTFDPALLASILFPRLNENSEKVVRNLCKTLAIALPCALLIG
jgi:hypothetical protein